MAVVGCQQSSVNQAIAERKELLSSLQDDVVSVLRGLRRGRDSEHGAQNLTAQTVEEACHRRERNGAEGAIDMPRERPSLATADVDTRDERVEDDIVGEGCVIENLQK